MNLNISNLKLFDSYRHKGIAYEVAEFLKRSVEIVEVVEDESPDVSDRYKVYVGGDGSDIETFFPKINCQKHYAKKSCRII